MVSELTRDRGYTSGWRAHGQSPSGEKILSVDHRSRGLVSRSVGEALH